MKKALQKPLIPVIRLLNPKQILPDFLIYLDEPYDEI